MTDDHGGCPDPVLCESCAEDIGWCMDAVVSDRLRAAVKRSTSMWVPGIVSARLQTLHPAYEPFRLSCEGSAAAVLVDEGYPLETAVACVRGAWWVLRMGGLDVNTGSVVRLAERAGAYRDGFINGFQSAREASVVAVDC